MPFRNYPSFGAFIETSGATVANDRKTATSAAKFVVTYCHAGEGGDVPDRVIGRIAAADKLREATVPEKTLGCSHVATNACTTCMPSTETDEMFYSEKKYAFPEETPSPTSMSSEIIEAQSKARSFCEKADCGVTGQTTVNEGSTCADVKTGESLEMTTCTTTTGDSVCFGVSSSGKDDRRWYNGGAAAAGRNSGQTLAKTVFLKERSGNASRERPRTASCFHNSIVQRESVRHPIEAAPVEISTLDSNAAGTVLGEASSFISSEAGGLTYSQKEEQGYADVTLAETAPTKAQSLFVPCLAVFSSNYNFTVTSVALFLMNQDPKYKDASEHLVGNSTIKMLSYAGAIFGMCTMGYLGDLIGRRLAMVFTLSLVCIGALLSSVCSWGDGVTVLIIMGVCRFILGVGSGGVYPLSAVSAAEGAATEQADERSMRVSWAYSMNVPGIMFPYVLALLLWWATENVDVCFRVLLAFGALPALLIWLPAWRAKDTRECSSRDFTKHLASVFVTRHYWRQLLGTGICWLLYDVTAYGILLVQPEITQVIWEGRSSVIDVIWQNIVLNGVGIPGCYMGILVLKKMGVKWLQFWGFVSLAGSAFLLAATSVALENVAWAQVMLLCVVNYFINWGASITTFILPSLVFPPEVRSTYSGISAALGKIGAVAGIYTMKAILSSSGLVPMMICAGIPAVLAALLTWWYVDPVPNTLKSSVLQCFGSLAGVCPFIECRRRARRFSS